MTRQALISALMFTLMTTTVFAGWSDPVLLSELNDSVSGQNAGAPYLSNDGLTMYFNRKNSSGISQLVAAYRDDVNGSFTSERVFSELTTDNRKVYDPWVSTDGLRLYYRRYFGGGTGYMIRMAERTNVNNTWSVTSHSYFDEIHIDTLHDWSPSFTANELNMFYMSWRSGTNAIWSATRLSIYDDFGVVTQFSNPTQLTGLGSGDISSPYVLPDGLTIYFSGIRDGRSTYDIYKATRFSLDEQFGNIELVSISSDIYNEGGIYVSSDQSEIYFTDERGIWHAVPEPASILLLGLGFAACRSRRRL